MVQMTIKTHTKNCTIMYFKMSVSFFIFQYYRLIPLVSPCNVLINTQSNQNLIDGPNRVAYVHQRWRI